MANFFSRVAFCALLACSAASFGCVDAETLPITPYENGITLSSNVKDWRDEIIYQLIVDRFYDGDINNNYNVDTRTLGKYHGGDWQGIIDKLDYLQELGVTTLWISPVVKNVEEDAGFASYHGYWTQDFIKHNPHFGDLATLRRLSDELHKRNMKLILDIVTNHVGQVFFYDINMNGSPNEWLAGTGVPDKGSNRNPNEASGLSRVTEYDPDFKAKGIDAYTSMGISGRAPVVFFDMPKINRVAPGPQNLDFNKDGKITGTEVLGFANPNWYHQRGRTYDYDSQIEGVGSKCKNGLNCWPVDENGDYSADGKFQKCNCPSGYTHRLTNYDGSVGDFLDGGTDESQARLYYQNDQTLLGDFPGGLKDVATERPDVRQAMIAVFSYWIDATDCDGFRIDTLKHVEYSFWETFAPAIRQHAASRGKKNFLMFGEAFDGNDSLLAAYTKDKNSVDSVFLFSQKYAIDQAFKQAPNNPSGSSNGTEALLGWDDEVRKLPGGRFDLHSNEPRPDGVVDASGQGVAPRDLLVNFLDNHDVGRYLYDRHDDNGVESLKNALSFLVTQRGIPCIYYGTEQGFMGGNDPANRENMSDPTASIFYSIQQSLYENYKPWDTGNPIFKHIQRLIKIRKAVPALRYGKPSGSAVTSASQGIYGIVREFEGQKVIIAINTDERNTNTISIPGQSGSFVDLLGDSSSVYNPSSLSVPKMTTLILVPKDQAPQI